MRVDLTIYIQGGIQKQLWKQSSRGRNTISRCDLLLLARYVLTETNKYDRRPTKVQRPTWRLIHTFWRISNGHNPAMLQPIPFVFRSRVGFLGQRIERRHFRLDQTQDGGRRPFWKIKRPYLWNALSDSLYLWTQVYFALGLYIQLSTHNVWQKTGHISQGEGGVTSRSTV